MFTPKKVITEFEGSKSECIRYAERLVSSLEEDGKKKGLKKK
jgi:hypothetical protein